MEALARTSLSQQAAASLTAAITEGRWPVGTKIPGEISLTRELGVSRSTVREAIRQLSARGMLDARHGVGVFVTATTPRDDWERLAEIAEVADLVQVRIAIETRAAALAADAHDAADADAIRAALGRRTDALDEPARVLAAADVALHRAIVAAAHNAPLLALFDSVDARLVPAMTELLQLVTTPPTDAADHDDLVAAVLARDPARAEALAREHLLGLAAALARVASHSAGRDGAES
ncbi:FCD domain-containing protein [Rhodococcus sp. HNM0569]|uniref:FadR/GntR family transcriptional regulator n=1 Tax=Rhodococcus sp. HNM0569 TaxID=2716340 RepID=UPI00146B7A70|nr:FCD domain-containing protein [Rhodococcus sp. HNM0569]NLU84951.1 FadR family transcriptional regulator [Rhodococcus sp. HNM0569]